MTEPAEHKVSSLLVLTVVTPGKRHILATALMRYWMSDPFAVSMEFSDGASPSVTWYLSRDLLTAGLATPSGEGDVKIRPFVGEAGIFHMTLSSADGEVQLWVPRPETAVFLRKTYDMVPYGQEINFMDLDLEIEKLLRDGGGK